MAAGELARAVVIYNTVTPAGLLGHVDYKWERRRAHVCGGRIVAMVWL